MRRLWLPVLATLLALLMLPAVAEKGMEQEAVDRAWLYLTQEARIPGDQLYEPSYERLTPTAYEPQAEAVLVVFRSAVSHASYYVYMRPEGLGLLLMQQIDVSQGLPQIQTLFISPDIRLSEGGL